MFWHTFLAPYFSRYRFIFLLDFFINVDSILIATLLAAKNYQSLGVTMFGSKPNIWHKSFATCLALAWARGVEEHQVSFFMTLH